MHIQDHNLVMSLSDVSEDAGWGCMLQHHTKLQSYGKTDVGIDQQHARQIF